MLIKSSRRRAFYYVLHQMIRVVFVESALEHHPRGLGETRGEATCLAFVCAVFPRRG
jgi:hypothetical protein